ncbi:MAG: zf-HC2 domain-containing protein [Pyrinomonadaceae bacterium]
MDCRRVEELLPLYVGGDVGEALGRRVSSHLSSCAGCRLLTEEHQRSRELLRSYDPPEFGEEFFEGIRGAVLREMAAGATRPTLLRRFGALLGVGPSGSRSLFPRGLTLAALTVAVLAFGLLFALWPGRQQTESAQAEAAQTELAKASVAPPVRAPEAGRAEPGAVKSDGAGPFETAAPPTFTNKRPEAVRVSAAPHGRGGLARSAGALAPRGARVERPAQSAGERLPGEESYLDAISALDTVISKNRGAMSRTLRAEYERNLSDVDRAIASTRAAALRHRDNPDMKDFVFAAYRGKVALLSEVAKQTQFPSAGF